MKRFQLLAIILATVCCQRLAAASLTPDREYYIIHSVYDKVLGSSEDGTTPALSDFVTNSADSASYVFVAEASGQNGYVLLRQKSTGRYLASSTSNSYGVVFQSSRSTADAYCWRVSEGLNQAIVNKRNTSRRLGIDGGKKGQDYVSVYYDKNRGSHAEFHIIPVVGNKLTTSRQEFESEVFTNSIGNQEIDYLQVHDRRIDRSDTIDIHIAANTKPISGSSRIYLRSLGTWLIFDNITPSDVIKNYLSYIYIKGVKASVGTNCRVAIYLNGAVVIPTASLRPMELFTEQNLEGTRTNLTATNRTTLTTKNNTTRSFILHRGYMATVATDIKGGGYSRVYVADHHDIVVNELPTALDQRISSVNVRPWQYVSKKGWCSTTGQGSNQTEAGKVRATWFYTWSADRSSTDNLEYIPIRQHLSWPSMSEIASYSVESANLSFNEPEHSEQHTSDKCSCGGTISAWTSCTKTPDFNVTGARIGSPAPTDASWLTEYIGHVDDMAYRCDFVAFHAYWGTNEAANAQAWYNRLKSIYDSTKRPIWITEWNNGASWTTESWPSNYSDQLEKQRKAIQEITEMLDTCRFVERYAIYNWDTYYRAMINWDDGSVLPAGQVYRDNRSTFAYNASVQKVPNWWAPAAKTPSFEMQRNESAGTLTFTIDNPNNDLTATLTVEVLTADGTWQQIAEVTDRSKFDSDDVVISGVDAAGLDLETARFRVVVKTLLGKTVTSATADMGYITNPSIETSTKNAVEGWTLTRDAANGYTKGTGDTYFEVWDATAANIHFNYYQDIDDLEPGIYRLSANVFNTTDNVSGAQVNGAVGLYAQTANQLYFAPVTTDQPIDADATSIDDVPQTAVERIIVTSGTLRVGVRNLGTMQARWAGADNFLLTRVADIDGVSIATEQAAADKSLYALMPPLTTGDTPRDATRFIVNPDANRKTSYGWTTSNVDFKSDEESYDGSATNTYWNIWKSGAFTSALSQTISGLPEGSYTFSALLRGQDTATMTLTATTADASVSQSFTGVGVAEGEYPQGWRRITTEPVFVKRGQSLDIKLNVQTSTTAWWSADHFALTLTEIPEELLGDVNGDGMVDLTDAIMIVYHTLGQQLANFNAVAADINGDGTIDLTDAILVVYKSLEP